MAQLKDALMVKKFHKDAVTPKRGSPGAAGYDISALEGGVVKAGKHAIFRTGLGIKMRISDAGKIPVAIIKSRSGMSFKHQIETGAGVIDCDYSGEIKVILRNNGDKDYEVKSGDRIAQMLIFQVSVPDVVEVQELPKTERGIKGFGSTGISKLLS